MYMNNTDSILYSIQPFNVQQLESPPSTKMLCSHGDNLDRL